MRDYQTLINHLTTAQDCLAKVGKNLQLSEEGNQAFSDLWKGIFALSPVIGTLKAWDKLQDEEMGQMEEMAFKELKEDQLWSSK